MENQPTKLDKAVKISIIVGIILVAFALFYYLLIRPKQEERAYSECLSAIKESGKFNDYTINTPVGKSALDICTKSNGAKKIIEENKQSELNRQQVEIRKQAEDAEHKKKELSPDELNKLMFKNVKGDWWDNGPVNIKGNIQNNNSFNVINVKIKFEFFSDKKNTNKIDEAYFAPSSIFYSNSNNTFEYSYMPKINSWLGYTYVILSGERQ